MEERSSPRNTVPVAALRWSWTLVLACGLLLGYEVLQTYGMPKHRQYQLDFGRAQWIEPVEASAPIAYFRKEVYLRSLPEQAWIEIAASDNFGLTVNGHTVATQSSVKTYETGIYDIKRALKQGTNVIAVSIARTSFPGSAQLLLRAQITQPGGKITHLLSDETWRVSNRTGIVSGFQDWTSPHVEDQVWPTARRSALNDRHVPLRWTETNPRLLQLSRTGYWIMAENAPSQAVFSTTFEADNSTEEAWIQLASSGDLDLAVNGHLITTASTAISGSKKLPHLANTEAASAPTAKPGRFAKPTEAAAKEKGSPFETTALNAYDISYWIKRGSNVIVAAVRSEHVPAALFAEGFLVSKDGTASRFSTNSKWQVGEQADTQRTATPQYAIEIGKDGMAPWGYLPQEFARPLDRAGFATLFRSCVIVGLTLGTVIGIWLVVSAIVSNWRREPLAYSMSRDALLHGPIIVGLLLLQLANFDPRFPVAWSFQPIVVVGAFAVLFLVRLLHLFVDRWTPAVAHAGLERVKVTAKWELRRIKAKQFISRDLHLPELFEIPFRQLLPYLSLVLIMFLGLGLRFHDLGYMSFDHDEMGLVAKSRGIFSLGFPYTIFAGEVRWLTTYEAIPYPLALSGLFFGYSEWAMRLPACLMGTVCIGVIGLMGRRLFDWRTGLVAAFFYACLPLNIRWAQNAFYLTQCQLMAMLTFWLFYEAIRSRPLHRNFLTAASITFCFTYLSWEGTGFLFRRSSLACSLCAGGNGGG